MLMSSEGFLLINLLRIDGFYNNVNRIIKIVVNVSNLKEKHEIFMKLN
jgi:hypothetical protein